MFQLVIPALETFDETKNEFVTTKGHTIQVEHSLVSIAKWESKWNKPFLTKEPKTVKETIDYIKCMSLTKNIPDSVYSNITNENIEEVSNYITSPMSATWFNDTKGGSSKEIITSEVLYYRMIAYNIPFECQKWHLNRLITLIRVCDKHNNPPKKMSKTEIGQRNKDLNNARRAQANSNG